MKPQDAAEHGLLNSALLTDLYELTMMQGYVEADMMEDAVFDLFVRRLPPQRNFLIAAGLEQSIEYLESLCFTSEEIDCLGETGLFGQSFLSYLETMRFSGDVHALEEGTVFFANEPIMRVTAPLPVAQLVESRLINIVHFQTLIASKAARCVLAAPDRMLVDFGMRRAHGGEAALWAARASYLAGFRGTSNVLAKPCFDIPIFGTMAHSYVQAHDSEIDAFRHFCTAHRGPIVLLIDTYDTEAGARHVIELARTLPKGAINSVRLDSGDLAALSRSVRSILDDGGCPDVQIFASGNLDEQKLLDLRDAPIDGFGIGTSLDISSDCPTLDFVYKLQEYAGRPRRKRSPGKETWPSRKQVYRERDENGIILRDTLTIDGDTQPGAPLLQPFMQAGSLTGPLPGLEELREHAQAELGTLSRELRDLEQPADYDVVVSDALRALADEVDREFH